MELQDVQELSNFFERRVSARQKNDSRGANASTPGPASMPARRYSTPSARVYASSTAIRDLDLLPWRAGPMRTPPPISPTSAAKAMVKAIEHGEHRRTHPATALLPLEIPALGRFVAKIVTRRVDTASALSPAAE